MVYLIDKDALVAKIEKLMYAANLELDIASTGDCFDENIAAAKYQLCNYILGVIDTLEVKEVNLEKEIRDYMQLYHLHIKDGGRIVFENNDSPNLMCDMRSIAKHFFELGMQQSKNYNNNEE